VPVTIDPKLFDDFYNGCCNGTFWPLFHSMPDRAIFENKHWEVKSIDLLEHIDGQIFPLQL